MQSQRIVLAAALLARRCSSGHLSISHSKLLSALLNAGTLQHTARRERSHNMEPARPDGACRLPSLSGKQLVPQQTASVHVPSSCSIKMHKDAPWSACRHGISHPGLARHKEPLREPQQQPRRLIRFVHNRLQQQRTSVDTGCRAQVRHCAPAAPPLYVLPQGPRYPTKA